MKILKNILILVFAIVFAVSCNEGIDSITAVDPGTDASAPVVTINFPAEGTQIQVPELIASMDIKFEVTDDIEIGSISVSIDGAEIANFSSFKDYRRSLQEITFDNVTNGDHILTITASDLQGKSTTATVNFMKAPPYVSMFDGETFFMPFDGDFMEMISFKNAATVGSPGFAGESLAGLDSYRGAADSYLTFPTEGLLSDEFSAAFWYKVNPSPDRAGILVVGDDADDRKQGFRLFREGNSDEQRIKLNVGTGESDVWNDGGVINVANGEWVHIAFTISQTKSKIFFNGVEMLSSDLSAGIDWTGCETITVGAGGETFSYWNHKSDNSAMDELRLFNKALTTSEIKSMINAALPYEPQYDGEVFYMPFEGDNIDLVSGNEAGMIGTPTFADDAKKGDKAFAGAADSYLTFPTEGLLGDQFSATFWYKANATPDRAGILVVGPPDVDNADYPTKQNLRKNGFRFFREGGETNQIFKLNAGSGEADSWFDGGADATIDPTANEWVHMGFTISDSECVVYINGEIAKQGEFAGVDWTGCDILSIGSGAPRFSGWDHLSDQSLMDELRLYNKALSQEEVQTVMNADN